MARNINNIAPVPDKPGLLKLLASIGFEPVPGYRIVVENGYHWQFFMHYGAVRVECCVYPPHEHNDPAQLWTASVFQLNESGTTIATAAYDCKAGWWITRCCI
ncbi:MAG TPA: hypothetical protein P5248_13350, partial [Bacteroidales bacterium]|nr:hypothetical protein [Bacteroidales bacterium]